MRSRAAARSVLSSVERLGAVVEIVAAALQQDNLLARGLHLERQRDARRPAADDQQVAAGLLRGGLRDAASVFDHCMLVSEVAGLKLIIV
jgi:hypothetical protein